MISAASSVASDFYYHSTWAIALKMILQKMLKTGEDVINCENAPKSGYIIEVSSSEIVNNCIQ